MDTYSVSVKITLYVLEKVTKLKNTFSFTFLLAQFAREPLVGNKDGSGK